MLQTRFVRGGNSHRRILNILEPGGWEAARRAFAEVTQKV